ncbi:LLM class flavin-dependent oxidoreductase [Leucobacter weissii]|uniref:LLM class flavin-dependent oxidoreductase n=1 Tax=Leucobacter weissii TaxID=1983706 RepID=A0A939S725_9MICO|nr:LLM class flavin-dependent oxidoreductase [Leucobacter weissii]MBO1900521.1 LLM class flavin-dependent oxidoreductase [Leucobacter weissii]
MRISFFSQVQDQFLPPAERYGHTLREIVRADELGFDTAWVSSIHFSGDSGGGLPSPLILLSAATQLTGRIRLGTSVITLSHENPIRAAEDASVVNHLSGDRLRIGYSMGGTVVSLEPFGLSFDDRKAIGARSLQRFREALRGEALGSRGQRMFPPGRELTRRMSRACLDPASSFRAGSDGDGLFLSCWQPRSSADDLRTLADYQNPIIDAYEEGLAEYRSRTGHDAEPDIAVSRTVLVFEEEHRERLVESSHRALARWAGGKEFVPEGTELTRERIWKEGHAVIGTPDEVAEQLLADTALARSTELAAQVQLIDPPHQDTLRSLELLIGPVARAAWDQEGSRAG